MVWTLEEIADKFRGTVVGDPALAVRPVALDAVDPTGIVFCEDRRAVARAAGVGALLLPRGLSRSGGSCVQVDDPRSVFHSLMEELVERPPLGVGVHPAAVVDPAGRVDPSARVGAYAVIERDAVIGPRALVYPFAYVGVNCHVGADSVLYPHCVLCQNVRLGERCAVHPGAVVGGEGFGFSSTARGWRSVPQVGGVQVGHDVEIRALASIDRGTCGDTGIGDGVKVGALSHIGHNARVGADSLIVPISGVGGSSVLGRRCVLGAQSGVSDHVTLADEVRVGARGGVGRDIRDAGDYIGSPARSLERELRIQALLPRMPDVLDRLRELERRLEAGHL